MTSIRRCVVKPFVALALLILCGAFMAVACGSRPPGVATVINASGEPINRIVLTLASGQTAERHALAANASAEMTFPVTADSELTAAVTFESGRYLASPPQSVIAAADNRFTVTVSDTAVEVKRAQ